MINIFIKNLTKYVQSGEEYKQIYPALLNSVPVTVDAAYSDPPDIVIAIDGSRIILIFPYFRPLVSVHSIIVIVIAWFQIK